MCWIIAMYLWYYKANVSYCLNMTRPVNIVALLLILWHDTCQDWLSLVVQNVEGRLKMNLTSIVTHDIEHTPITFYVVIISILLSTY